MVISVIHNKGGVGKTTTAVNLSAALARRDQRVLLVDLDPQGSASLSLGVKPSADRPSVNSALAKHSTFSEALVTTSVTGLSLLPASPNLGELLELLDERTETFPFCRMFRETPANQFDYIVLDNAPGWSSLQKHALTSSDFYLVPVVPQYLAIESLVIFLETVEHLCGKMANPPQLLGLLLTLVDYRTKVAKEISHILRNYFKGPVFGSEIRVNVRLAEAPSFGKDIFNYDPKSSGADSYSRLAEEVMAMARKPGLPHAAEMIATH